MAHLKHIHLENFKSWRGKQLIGPFLGFTCIIGTNGSGKSNLMDALSFVMGERAAALRVRHLSDLIHGAHVGRPVSRTARVSVLYCYEEEREVEFSRTIRGDTSDYHIDGVCVTFAKYSEELQEIGVITRTQNCLVFQGAVESIALKEPKERTRMLEYISQSKDFAEEYNMKKRALQKTQEDSRFHLNKKRSVTAEKKQVSQERLEAQTYQVLVDQLAHNRLQLSLTELFNNQQFIEALSDTLAERRLATAAKSEELVSWEQMVKSHKKEQGRLSRELQHMEKEINSQDRVVSQARSQYIKVKVNTSHHIKKAEEARGALKKTQKQLSLKEQELEEGRQEITGLERTWRAYEQQVLEEQAAQTRNIQLNQDQSERYEELKELARKQGAVLRQQVEKLHWQVKADHEQMMFDQRRKKEMQATVKNYQSHLEELSSRAEKLELYNNTCRSSLDKLREEEKKLSAQLERGSQRQQEVNQELNQVMEDLSNGRLARQESRRQLHRRELLEKLRRLFPLDVYGRLSDLCCPVHKKYQLAVTKVFNRYINAIVVTTEKVARDCIYFLKEERMEPETFLPVNNLAVSPLSERLRELRGAKLLVDVVEVNATPAGGEQLRKVVQFVSGNTLVCESIKEARRMAFDRGDRNTTVALDGTMFSKNGVISGGSCHLRKKARCWDEKDLLMLREQKELLTAELRDLVKLRRKESNVKHITAQIQGVHTRLKYSGAEWSNLLKKYIPQCKADISRMESELVNLDANIQMQQDNVEAKDGELKAMKHQVEQMEDLVFLEFCAEIGVSSIREYEQQQLKQGLELDRKRLEFESQCTRMNAKLEYDEEQVEQVRKKLQKIEDNISSVETIITEQRKDEMKLLKAVEEAEDKLLELKNQTTSKRSQAAAGKAELDQEIQRLQEVNKELVKLQREVMSSESALEQKRLARHNMLLACKIHNVAVGLLSGSLSEISEVQLETESGSTPATMDIFEREAQLVIDYSSVEAELRRMRSDKEMDAHLQQLRDSLSSIEAVLNQTAAPNLKALVKMTELKEKLLEVREALDASTKAARKCSQEFNQVKALRFHCFSQCFEHVSIAIDQIYKRLCRNSSAQAILSADNPDEPYLGGINYSCVAPGKRFMSMDNLSGGEKAIAALAMIFAIHSFCPAPFFILDEVDAALDNTNISKVTHFIREECRENMQIIAISLKEEFFSQADALLGVYSDFDEFMFSRVLTLDLRPYPLKDETGTESGADGPLDFEVDP